MGRETNSHPDKLQINDEILHPKGGRASAPLLISGRPSKACNMERGDKVTFPWSNLTDTL